MKTIITGDIHLDPNPDNEYRWRVLRTITRHLSRDDVDSVIIAGDLVDRKDKHTAAFVNRVVREVTDVASHGRLIILKGNHDYIDKDCPFFGFLGRLKNVEYIVHPRSMGFGIARVLLVPQGENWRSDVGWRRELPIGGPKFSDKPWDLIVTHETFQGAMASTDIELDGLPLASVSKEVTRGAPVVSGDIHVPQQIGNVLYAGSPHHVRFGDDFEPRMLLWDFEKGKAATLPMGGLRRLTVNYRLDGDHLKADAEIREGDHVKVRFHGDHAAQLRWGEIAEDIRGIHHGLNAIHFGEEFHLEEGAPLELDGAEPDAVDDSEYFAEYCAANEIDPAVAQGLAQWL